jgi:decaprenylphospho-beta-D-erythro-pentofuranosid-2-ulose 2-reductase
VIDSLGNAQSILLAGGTSEIGLAVVQELSSSRLERVVLAGRDLVALKAAGASLSIGGAVVDEVTLDIEATATHDALLDQAFAVGDIDVAIVAIGLLGDQAKDEQDADAVEHILKVNFTDSATLCLRILQRLAAQGHGTLVVFSSVAAVRARRANFIYGAGKAGLDAFVQGLIEMGRDCGVEVVLVRPGFVRTRMTQGMAEAPFTVDPADVARDVANAMRKGRTIVYSPAPVGAVAATLKVLPRPILRKMPR